MRSATLNFTDTGRKMPHLQKHSANAYGDDIGKRPKLFCFHARGNQMDASIFSRKWVKEYQVCPRDSPVSTWYREFAATFNRLDAPPARLV